jgi:MFS family permease
MLPAVLRNPDFARLLSGRLVTNAGDSLYAVAAMWLVFDLTGSEAFTGLAGFLVMSPNLLQAFVGPLVDRWSLRAVMVWSQLIQAVLVLAVPVAAWLGVLSVWVVLTVIPLAAFVNQFAYPAQQAALPRIVDDEELVRANAALQVGYGGVDAAFNAVAGLLVAAVGAVALYLVDAVTFLLAAALFVSLRVPARTASADTAPSVGRSTGETPTGETPTGETTAADDPTAGGDQAPTLAGDGGRDRVGLRGAVDRYLDDLRGGVGFVRGTLLLPLLVTGLVANFTLGGVTAVLPSFAAGYGGADVYGVLLAGIGTGTLLGALLASRLDHLPVGVLSMGGFLLSAGLWGLGVASPWAPATAVLFALAFVPVGVTNVVIMSMVQRLVPEGMLGRVSALLGSASTAMAPVGSLLGGVSAAWLGVGTVAGGAALGFLFIAVYTAVVPQLRTLPPAAELETLAA